MKIRLLIALSFMLTLSVHANDHLAPSDKVQSNDQVIVNLAESLTKIFESDLDKSRAIHKWVTKNISYDQSTLKKIELGFYDPASEGAQDANSVLESKTAVCEGYANLAAALHRAIGIPAKVSIGKSSPHPYRLYPLYKMNNLFSDLNKVTSLHAWAEVKINGKWLPVDPTFDAGSVVNGGAWVRNVQTDFFNPDPEYFNRTHLKTGEMDQ